MPDEIIEGEAREITPDRAVVVAQPGQALVASDAPTGSVDMLARASLIATALSRMVEKQKLYTVIRGKKYPNVEAWQTIGRMDNVVAREAQRPERNEDGSWEAFVELVRLSDGMVIGNGSALCGADRDGDWTKRADHEKRSMAVTRATSRAFRQQYAWVMALAGYEPTPADEMPRDGGAAPTNTPTQRDGSLIGTVTKQKAMTTDYLVRMDPQGVAHLGFRLASGAGAGLICEVLGPMAEALVPLEPKVLGQRVQIWGEFVEYEPPVVKHAYRAFRVSRIQTSEFTLPADLGVQPMPEGEELSLLDDEPLDPELEAAIDAVPMPLPEFA